MCDSFFLFAKTKQTQDVVKSLIWKYVVSVKKTIHNTIN